MRIEMNEAALHDLVNNQAGVIARELEVIANTTGIADATEALSVPSTLSPSSEGSTGFPQWTPNPPPGPPLMRSGDMVDSLKVLPVERDERGAVAYVIADAVHRGFNYPNHLRVGRDYVFLPERPYYTYNAI